VADPPKLPLPNVPGAAANLLALPAAPASLPTLSAPVELARRESRIAKRERLRANEVAPTALQLKLQPGKTAANLALASPIVLPLLSAPVELARRESKIVRPGQQKLNEMPANALQLRLERGRAPNLVDTQANVALAAPPPPRPRLPKEITIEA